MKKKILIVNDEMVIGGVSRVLINMLTKFDYDNYDVTLLVLHKHGPVLSEVPANVNVIGGTSFFDVCDIPFKECLKNGKLLKKIRFYNLIKSGKIKKYIEIERKKILKDKFDVEIAFKEGICSIFVGYGDTPNKINWIHADYKVHNYAKNYMNTMINVLRNFNHQIAVSNTAARSFEEVFDLHNVETIHNIILDDQIMKKSQEYKIDKSEIFTFVTVGRLHPQKGYDHLLEAMQLINQKHKNYQVLIIGDGSEKDSLLQLKDKLDIENAIFLGQKTNPFPYMLSADAFVLSSRYEGLPTVIFESLILHLPVISVNVAGIEEQLQDKYGMIVQNDVKNLAQGMQEMMSNKEKYEIYKNNLGNYRYDNLQIMKKIYHLFQ